MIFSSSLSLSFFLVLFVIKSSRRGEKIASRACLARLADRPAGSQLWPTWRTSGARESERADCDTLARSHMSMRRYFAAVARETEGCGVER